MTVTKIKSFFGSTAFIAFIYFVVATCIATYPLVFKMGRYIPGQIGDNIYFVWLIAWYQKALFQLHTSPFFNSSLNYPQGWSLASTDTAPAMVALALPVSWFFGQVAGYNFAMLLSFVLSGWGMYLWVKYLTHDDGAGLVAGTIFAFTPYRMTHFLAGHLSLVGTQWFPFYFWFFFELLRSNGKLAWKPILLASISAALIALSSPYYAYMTVIISLAFFIFFVVFGGWNRFRNLVFWKNISLFIVSSATLVGMALLPYVNLGLKEGLASRPLGYVGSYSASVSDFLLPSTMHFLWGKWVGGNFDRSMWMEATLYLGVIAVILAIVGWAMRKKYDTPSLLWILALTALTAIILAMGVELRWMNKRIYSFPVFIQAIIGRKDLPEFYMPDILLYAYLPMFNKMRVMMRFGIFAITFISVMAGIGAHLLKKIMPERSKVWVTVILLALVIIDFYPRPLREFSLVDARPVDYWLAEQPADGAVAQFPFSQEDDQDQVYNTLVNGKPFIGGFFNANQPKQYNQIAPVMGKFPSQESVDLLKNLSVAYVVVDSLQYPDFSGINSVIQSLGLKLIHISGNQYVYGFR